MTSRLRSALLTGTVAAALALGAAPAQAIGTDAAGQPAQAGESAPAATSDVNVAEALAPEAAPIDAAAPADALSAPELVPAGTEEAVADAVIPLLVEDSPAASNGEAPDETGGEAAGEVIGEAAEEEAPAEDGNGGESVPAPAPAVPGTDPSSGAGTDPAPETGAAAPETAPTTPAEEPTAQPAPTPPAANPGMVESVVVGGRTLTHADFNIPDDVAAGDEETITRWMEENIELVLESDGMQYLVDLMLGYLMAGDLNGLADLIREMSVSDPAAGEELIQWMYELFQDFGEWPVDFEDWPGDAEPGFAQAPSSEPAPVVSPASLDVAPADGLAPEAPATDLAFVGAPATELARTGTSGGTLWLASGGAGLLLLGGALLGWRRRSISAAAIR
ncbi:LPXTG cell wall anchor domain-containing protein [Arthrobacter sp. USHLN218]|uniref:LPXTG cell wall anchor domain-containing protein n=1 Tax=Arthrobacter sp. USHLN218 TaxID=3081232 RepID=UPI0030193EBD